MGLGRGRTGWAAAVLLATVLGRWTRPAGDDLALVWPAAGVAFLWLAWTQHRRGRLVVDALLLAAVTGVVNGLTGAPVALAAGLGVANAAQTVVAVTVWSRRPGHLGGLRTPGDLAALLVASVAGAAVGASVGPPLAALTGSADLGLAMGSWLVRDGAGTALVAIVGLAWTTPRHAAVAVRPGRWETVALLLVGGATAAAVLALSTGRPVAFLLVPVILWAGLRESTRGSAVVVALLSVATVVATLAGRGPFGTLPEPARALTAQVFLVLLATVTSVLALYRDGRLELLAEVLDAAHRAQEQRDLLEAVFASTNDGILVVDRTGRFLLHNPSARELLGPLPVDGGPRWWSEDVGLRTTTGDPFPPDRLPLARAVRGEVVPWEDVVRAAADPHQDVVLSVSARPLPGGRGAVAAFHDVTRDRRVARRVQDSRDLLRSVLDGATEQAIVATDARGRIVVFSRGAQRMLGWTEEQTVGRPAGRFWDHAEVADRAAELGVSPGFEVFVAAARAGRPETRNCTLRTATGDRLTVRLTVTAIREGVDGPVSGYLGVAHDITTQLAAERALAGSELRFRLAFGNAPVGLAVLDLAPGRTGVVLQANEALAALTGRAAADLPGTGILGLLHPDEVVATRAVLQQLADGEVDRCSQELRFVRLDGEVVRGHCSASVMQPDPAAPGQLVVLVEDVTARRLAEEALTRQALHDPLTDLPNRTLLVDRLEQALGGLTRSHHRVGLLYLDLDGFKAVNDSAGHDAGDAVLVQVARRLTAAVRPGDTVARLGGDEFAVLCPDVAHPDDVHAVADRLLAAVAVPLTVADRSHCVGASIGLVVSGPGVRAEQLLHDADQAMYESKHTGKGRVTVHRTDVETRAARSTRLRPELGAALDAGDLVLHGQPVVDLSTGAVVAVETLLRWQHPTRGLLPPAEFLDVVESSDLVQPVGRMVLTASCVAAARWANLLGDTAPAVHVNVSGRQLDEGHLVDDVRAALDASGLAPGRLVLELTETHVPVLADSLRADLDLLRGRGVQLALDDVGTGWSSLVRLTELPVDVLKVDRVFVAGLGVDPACDAVVRAVVGLGAALGVGVVAEGVETGPQHDLLVQAGCPTGQGHRYGRPLPLQDVGAELVRRATVAAGAPADRPRG